MHKNNSVVNVAVVTGAASGIGLGVAKKLLDQGYKVVLTDVSFSDFNENMKGDFETFVLDVTCEEHWQRFSEYLNRAGYQLEFLVNNAGIGSSNSIESTDLEQWQKIQSINSTGVFLGCKYAVEMMKKTGGAIVNISSVLGVRPLSNVPAYGASKAAVINLTKSTALHCAESRYNIRCNAVTPGFIRTPLLLNSVEESDDPQAMMDAYNQLHPMGHIGEIEDVANAVVFLSSAEAKFITGINLPVDGGYSI